MLLRYFTQGFDMQKLVKFFFCIAWGFQGLLCSDISPRYRNNPYDRLTGKTVLAGIIQAPVIAQTHIPLPRSQQNSVSVRSVVIPGGNDLLHRLQQVVRPVVVGREEQRVQELQQKRIDELWDYCTTFNWVDDRDQEQKYQSLREWLGQQKYTVAEINMFNKEGQTLAHRLTPLGDWGLFAVLIDYGLDVTVRSQEEGRFKGSTAAHSLAGLYMHASRHYNEYKMNHYKRCLQMIIERHPKLLETQADNGYCVCGILRNKYRVLFTNSNARNNYQ